MSRGRVWMVYAVFAAVVGGHLLEIVTQREHWPFSPYPMWSFASTSWDLQDHRLYGVTDEPSPREILLQKPEYFAPLPSRFMRLQMIHGLEEAKHGRPQRLDAITRDYLRRYEQRREAGLHHGPPLRGLRMYLYEWHMDRDASNRASPERLVFYETRGATGVVATAATGSDAIGGDADAE